MARPKHRTTPGGTYFATTNTWEHRALFHKPEWARVFEVKLFDYRDRGEYLLHAYVVMPDHIHAILTPSRETTLERAANLFKGGASHEIGQKFGTKFPVWQPGFAEHLIRNQADYEAHLGYIEMNPVKAGLCRSALEYEFCSASGRIRIDVWPSFRG